MAKLIELKGISKSYDGEKVIDSMNLYIRDKEFITLTDETDTERDYEVIDKCEIDGALYLAVAPAEYYILKRVQSGKKEDTLVTVEGAELQKAFAVFDKRLNTIDHDEE